MKNQTEIKHVALQYKDKAQAKIFFKDILGLSLIKNFKLSDELSRQIFGRSEEVEVIVYGNNSATFELFINEKKQSSVFEHICINIDNKEDFIKRCKKHGLNPFFVEKGEKKLLFLRDFADNLYEIK
jgi:catechol 2,3-dioxygenase-like lactoylglutathione lyase family enzyme